MVSEYIRYFSIELKMIDTVLMLPLLPTITINHTKIPKGDLGYTNFINPQTSGCLIREERIGMSATFAEALLHTTLLRGQTIWNKQTKAAEKRHPEGKRNQKEVEIR